MKVLIPNGVDYAAIKADAPNALQGLTALTLQTKDVDYIPLRVWTALNPGVILWDDVSLSPFTTSYGLDGRSAVSLAADGKSAWIEP